MQRIKPVLKSDALRWQDPTSWDWVSAASLQLFLLGADRGAADTWSQERVNSHPPAAASFDSPGGNLGPLKRTGNELLWCGASMMA